MKSMTLKALKGSIRKWEDIVNGTGEDRGSINCPLCKQGMQSNIFLGVFKDDGLCDGCIISDATGRDLCDGTPYESWLYHQHIIHKSYSHKIKPNCKKCALLAKQELNFLNSLLPKKKRRKRR